MITSQLFAQIVYFFVENWSFLPFSPLTIFRLIPQKLRNLFRKSAKSRVFEKKSGDFAFKPSGHTDLGSGLDITYII